MDKKDERILSVLLENSRISITSLAKKVGVSREVAIYRVNNLNKTVIKGYYSRINLEKLGYKRHGCFMQFKGVSQEMEEKLLEKIAEHPFVSYLGPVVGKWNVVFDIHAKDQLHLKEILENIIVLVNPYLESYLINSPELSFDFFPQKFVGVKKTKNKLNIKESDLKIDDVDKKLLKLLSSNSRIDYVELSKILKLAPNSIKYRIKNLEKANIIEGYTITIDYTKLDLQFFNIQIKLNSLEDKKLLSYLLLHQNILYYYQYLGQENWDLDVGVISKNAEDFRRVIIDLKKNFGEKLKIHDIYMVTHVIKDNVAPEGIFS